jgi:hypothetical protein
LPLGESRAFDLAGPEALTHRTLVTRAAALHRRTPLLVPIPLSLVRAFAALLERFSSNPPLTPAMLEVLQHDDRIDDHAGAEMLGLRLTPVDEMLRRYVGPEVHEA